MNLLVVSEQPGQSGSCIKAACKAWNDPEWLEAVEFINSKNNFMALAKELGIDVPLTQCFTSADDISEMDIISFNMPCYLKAAVSILAIFIFRYSVCRCVKMCG